ncbi:MAG: DUF6786 family protein [Thermoguttaceae bacterium]|jgi:hypothetical protein
MGRWLAILASIGSLLAAAGAHGAETKGNPMTYGEVRAMLAKHTEVVELTNPSGGRVAVCPGWQGRVMTSTCGGPDGPSFGFINDEYITAGKLDLHFNNYGGEERLWLSPEGGQFSLWFKPGQAQTLTDWYTPPAFNEGAWRVVSGPNEPVRMTAGMQFQNASGTAFHLDVNREVRLLEKEAICRLLGPSAAEIIAAPPAKMVAYETENRLTNRGQPVTREKGLVSIWILGMMNSGPETVVIVPYQAGPEAELGPTVKSDYFGAVPPERLKALPQAVLLRADGHCRAKIGVSQRRARNILGSIDFRGGVLTLVSFSMPEDPTRWPYMNNQWGGPHAEPYRGDVVNSYNDGPPAPGKKGMGAFYEIESLSPAKPLARGQSLVHSHRTIHVQADGPTLAKLAKELLGVDLETVRQAMLK